jgi:WXG100 family type VII secretion target
VTVYNYGALDDTVSQLTKASQGIQSLVDDTASQVLALINNKQFYGQAATKYQELANQINRELSSQGQVLQSAAKAVESGSQAMNDGDRRAANGFA